MVFRPFPAFAAVVLAATLAACSEPEQPKAEAPPPEHGVFVSSTDCADTGKLTLDQCGQAIDQAVAVHNETSAIHKSLRQCEGAEGPERCDKIGESEYRARIQAFFVIMSDPPSAVPLYPPQGSTAGFRSPSKQELSAADDTLNMSHAALAVANENSKLPAAAGDGGAALGAAAASIH